MSLQPSLFDAVPAARNADPETSKLAAANRQPRAASQCGRLLAVYATAEHWNGLTDEQAATAAGLPARSCWWKRCSELRALELIAPTGTTVTSSMGELVQVCAITRDGMALAARHKAGA